MIRHYGILAAALAATTIALFAPTVSVADNQADRDTKEVSNYVLTEAALAKYTQAAHSLKPLLENSPAACNEDSEGTKSLNDMAARMDGIPGVQAAMHSAGLSSHEYLVFSMSLVQNGMAAWALDQPGGKLPPGTQMANVNFYRAHDADFKKLGEETKPAACGDDDRDNEPEE